MYAVLHKYKVAKKGNTLGKCVIHCKLLYN